jgi:hypothetical protein
MQIRLIIIDQKKGKMSHGEGGGSEKSQNVSHIILMALTSFLHDMM